MQKSIDFGHETVETYKFDKSKFYPLRKKTIPVDPKQAIRVDPHELRLINEEVLYFLFDAYTKQPGQMVVYNGHTTCPLWRRINAHRKNFDFSTIRYVTVSQVREFEEKHRLTPRSMSTWEKIYTRQLKPIFNVYNK